MSTTSSSYTMRVADQHRAVADFLDLYGDRLDALDYGAMSEKMGGDTDSFPYIGISAFGYGVRIYVHGTDQRATMRTLRKMIGGKWDKRGSGDQFVITRDDWNNTGRAEINVAIQGSRDEVCQKVVTGVKEVHHDAVEAAPARTEYVDEVEWVCGNLLSDGEDS